MGGDHGPPVILPAAVKAIQLHAHIHFILCGDENIIRPGILCLTDSERKRVTVVHCSQVVEMGEQPTSALRNKKDSSMRRAIELVESGEVLTKSDSFIAENGDSNYAALAAFVAAKEAVEKGEFEAAVAKLTWLQDNLENPELKATAILRLARVQAQLTQYDAALKTLSQTTPEAFKAQVAEVKGDVYLAKGDKENARTQYETALTESKEGNNGLLQIKLDNLATAQPAA